MTEQELQVGVLAYIIVAILVTILLSFSFREIEGSLNDVSLLRAMLWGAMWPGAIALLSVAVIMDVFHFLFPRRNR